MAVQTTVTTAYRSHAVEGLNGFVSMRTSVAYRRGSSECRIGANQAGGLLTSEASGFFEVAVTWLGTAVHTLEVRDRGHGWGTTHHPSEMTVALTGNPPTCQDLVANRLLVPIHGRGVWRFGKWRDVVDLIRAFSVHGPDVPALGTAVVVSAGQFARERQKLARRTVTRWTVRDRGHAGVPPLSMGHGSSRY